MTPLPRLAITGLGVVSPYGCTPAELLEALRSAPLPSRKMSPTGRPGRELDVVTCEAFDAGKYFPPMKVRRWDACSRFTAVAAKLAMEDAALPIPGGEAVGILAGTWSAGATPLADFMSTVFRDGPEAAPPMLFPFTVANAAASQAAIELGLRGPIATLSHRSTVFADQLRYAAILLAEERCEAVVSIGTDEVNPTYFRAWDDLGIVRRTGHPGLVLGDGGYAFALETEARARGRGAKIHALVAGVGAAIVRESPHRYATSKEPYLAADRDALAQAGRAAADVDFVARTANGLPGADAAEAEALAELFRGSPPEAPRWKPMLGDGGGPAAGVAVAAAAAISTGSLPPDRGGAEGALPASPRKPRRGLVHFAGAGGSHFSVLLERAG